MKELFNDIVQGIDDFGNSVGNFVSGLIFFVIFLAIIFGVIVLCIWLTGLFQRWGEKGGKQRERIVSIILNMLLVSLILSVAVAIVYFFWEGLLYILGFGIAVLLWSYLSKYLDAKDGG